VKQNWLTEFENNFKGSLDYEFSCPLKRLTTLQIGGNADVYALPASIEGLRKLLQFVKSNAVPAFLIGRGSNLLFCDEGVRGIVYSLRHSSFSQISLEPGNLIRVGAGASLCALTRFTENNGLSGFEFLSGIPGSVGGALSMNAGAYGYSIADRLVTVDVLTDENKVKSISAKDIEHSYRSCPFFEKNIALTAVFQGSNGDRMEISKRIKELHQKRSNSQPKFPSAGCTFKNPNGNSAGRLIDEAGLKGYAVGGAEISKIHANFFVNRGNAQASDILKLIEIAKSKVFDNTGITLEPEIIVVDEFGRLFPKD